MDARITRTNDTFKLVNIDNDQVEATGLTYLSARDEQNKLWSRGFRTEVVKEGGAA